MAKITIRDERCKSCALCVVACPKKIVAISKERYNSKGFHVAECVDMNACIGCAFCAVMCPDVAITVEK
jgi:2-oxoglutarate ferredoxin oxidoreductase subunit delta